MYDGRVGRWMTTDPYSQYHSPYLAMGNDPINLVDPDGGFASSPLDDYVYDINTGVLHHFETDEPDKFYVGTVSENEYTLLTEGVELSTLSLNNLVGRNLRNEGIFVDKEDRLDALNIMRTISFEENVELSAYGFGYTAGTKDVITDMLIILPWKGNSATISVNSFDKAFSQANHASGWKDGKIIPYGNNIFLQMGGKKPFGVIKYHIHTQPGTHGYKDRASIDDYGFHQSFSRQLKTYIISREGVTKFNHENYNTKSGKSSRTINDYILRNMYWGL